jgi:hypothetical protein
MEAQSEGTVLAGELMTRFAERTGVLPGPPPRRYLWTDAFAVCNFLGLVRAQASAPFMDLAARLVDQTHQVLGRFRPDDSRSGWISGLTGTEALEHPTRGGLRIGKVRPERGPGEPPDPELEWEQDGQYFHYLTRWMHALDQFASHTGRPAGNRWARELAERAHSAFTYEPYPGGPKRMVWKMSVDLTRPLVASMGQHDPLDGLITYRQLRAHGAGAEGPTLEREVAEMGRIAAGRDWWTDDPLGLGGLLADGYRLMQLGGESAADRRLLAETLEAAASGCLAYLRAGSFRQPAARRLAFRELGLSIGLHAAIRMGQALRQRPGPWTELPTIRSSLEVLVEQEPAIAQIEAFWLRPEQQRSETWVAHQDINGVMLATSLAPEGFLEFA